MIESDHYLDPATGLPVHSLYSEVRKPTPEMLDGLTAVLFDLQDVGVRIYTFIWTMALAMEACGEAGVRFVVLDRPNPIGGLLREGPLLVAGFESFVGLHPTPMRHGLTVGEVAPSVAVVLQCSACADVGRSWFLVVVVLLRGLDLFEQIVVSMRDEVAPYHVGVAVVWWLREVADKNSSLIDRRSNRAVDVGDVKCPSG